MTLNNEEKNNKNKSNESLFDPNDFVCSNCGYVVEPVKVVRGNLATEIILWFFFIIPGICYSVWRVSGKGMVCPKCNSSQLVPIDSPKGEELALKSKRYKTPIKPFWKKTWFIVVAGVTIFVIIGLLSQGN